MSHLFKVFSLYILFHLGFSFNSDGRDIVIKYIVDTKYNFHPVNPIRLILASNKFNELIDNFQDPALQIKGEKIKVLTDTSKEIFLMKYKNIKPGLYFLLDGLGREIILYPDSSDTIPITISQKTSIKEKSIIEDKPITSSWFTKISTDKKHAYVMFFDSLALLHGDINVRLNYSLQLSNKNLEEYLIKVNNVYHDRIDFFKEFSKRNFFPDELKYLAYKEIQYSYYDDLLEPIVLNKIEDLYPAYLIDTLSSIEKDINNSYLFKNTGLYRKVLTEYLFNVINKRDKSISRTKGHLVNCYAYCNKYLKGDIKDYALGSLLRDYILYDPTHSVNDVFYAFQKTKSGSIKYITQLYKEHILTNGISPSNILSLKVENANHQLVELKSLFTRNLILIDCWATWCIPCRKQIPYLDSLNERMAHKLQIISLSGDENISKWYTWLSKSTRSNNSIAQVHAPDGFKNIFFKGLNISSIPRYILINNSGILLNTEMPFPYQIDKIIKIINTLSK